MKKNRERTEKKIIDAAITIIDREGFEFLGINAVAKEAQVSKVLIYRYFTSLEGLISKVISANDFWADIPSMPIKETSAEEQIKEIFRHKAKLLRENTIVRKFYRWRLLSDKTSVFDIKSEREVKGWEMMYKYCDALGISEKDADKIVTLINYAIDHMTITYDTKRIRGLDLSDDEEWEHFLECIDDTTDLLLKKYAKR
ncbi:MAG: TetR/AcrR family transcriptional regulator [Candidatus Limimorpha sp.]